MTARRDLHKALRLSAELKRRRLADPLRYIGWLPGQLAFLGDASKRKLARWGNQWGGKTTVGLADLHYRCIGQHPYRVVRRPPITAWIICASWTQSVEVQEKLWKMVGGTGHLVEGVTFDSKNGFGAKNPTVSYKNGSKIRFRTTNQGGLNLSSATIHVAMFDEPPTSERIYEEVQKRVLKTNGDVILTLTPINAPVEWLKEQCEAGNIVDHHYRLEAQNLIPVGASTPLRLEDGAPMDQAWIDRVRKETLPREAPVVLDGEWEVHVEGAVFSAFDHTPGGHVGLAPWMRGRLETVLGIDHGDGTNFSQVAVLAVVDTAGRYPRVCILDEYISSGMTTTDMDAASILGLLQRQSTAWHELDHVHGDRKHGGRRGGLGRKSNRKLQQELADLANLPYDSLRPSIRTVKRGEGQLQGSVSEGVNFLHRAMVRPGHFYIAPRCTRLIESIQKWDYRDTEWKHAIDALRYALHPYIFPRRTKRR